MTKKQVMLVSIVAAIPGGFLLYFLVIGLLQGMLGDKATVSVALWLAWVLAVLGSVVATGFPFAVMLFPGLFPDGAAAAVDGSASGISAPPSRKSSKSEDDDDDVIEEDEEEFEEADDEESDDEGEQLFEDEAFDDDFDDEFDNKK